MTTWVETHIPSITDAIEIANELLWNISIVQVGQQWFVRGGEKVLLCANTEEAAENFVYGMAAAYAVLPDAVLEQVLHDYGLAEETDNTPST